jgi:hypothetical protein
MGDRAVAFPLWRAVLVLAVAWLLLAGPWLFGSVTVPWDAKAHFQPQLQFLASSIHSGQSPFWTPHVFSGHPQVADPQSLIFSPPFLLLALLTPAPSLQMMDAVSFASLLAGAFAIVVYFRDRGWHEAGALVAALAFAFGGAAAWRIQHVGQVISLAWWPIALLFLDRALRSSPSLSGKIGYGALAGLAAGFMLLGRDQVAFLALLALAGYVIVQLGGQGGWFRLRSSVPVLLSGAIAGALTVTIPLMLTLALAADSNRASIDLVEAGKGSLHPASLLAAVVPHLFGISRPLTDYWGPPSPDWGPVDLFLARNMSTWYFGVLPLLGIIVAFVQRFPDSRREALFFFGLFVATLLYALGRYTPFFGVVFHVVPGIDLFRRPADALFLVGAAGAIAGGYGLHLWVTRPGWRPGTRHWLPPALLFSACLGCGWWLAGTVGRQQQSILPLVAAGAFMVGSVLALVLARRFPVSGCLPALVLTGAITADLAWNNAPNESTGLPVETYEVLDPRSTNPTIALLKRSLAATAAPDRRDRVELAGLGFHWPNASLVHGLDHTLGYNPVRSRLYSDTYGAEDHIALPDQRRFTPLFPGYDSPLADLAGLRFLATPVPIEMLSPATSPGKLALIVRTQDGYVYENRDALPRVMAVGQAKAADFAAMTRNGVWPAVDFRREVLLAETDIGQAPHGEARPGRALIARYRNTEIRVDVELPDGGWLVLHDVWHPWWTAMVRGQPTPILRANVAFRAVRVPPGRSEVVFAFQPFTGAIRSWRDRLGGQKPS